MRLCCHSSLLTTILSSNSLYKNSQNNDNPLSEDEVRDIKAEQIEKVKQILNDEIADLH